MSAIKFLLDYIREDIPSVVTWNAFLPSPWNNLHDTYRMMPSMMGVPLNPIQLRLLEARAGM